MNSDTEQHSVVKSICLHLFPGVLMLAFYLTVASLVMKSGFPPALALFLGVIFVIIPFQLGYLFHEGKKRNGRFSLQGIVLYRESIPMRQYLVFIPLIVGWAAFCFIVIFPPIEKFLFNSLFYWLPVWSFSPDIIIASRDDAVHFSESAWITTWILGFMASGAAAIVEELYFRGYLLPRIAHLKSWAPLVNTVLFSIYHFWTPWQNLTRIVAVLPWVYTVWQKKNIYVGMGAHFTLNTGSAVLTLI